jgi:hypothetical protein
VADSLRDSAALAERVPHHLAGRLAPRFGGTRGPSNVIHLCVGVIIGLEVIAMSDSNLRREIKKTIDRLPADRLSSLADYVAFLDSPTLRLRVEQAERDLKANKGVNWRAVRNDV